MYIYREKEKEMKEEMIIEIINIMMMMSVMMIIVMMMMKFAIMMMMDYKTCMDTINSLTLSRNLFILVFKLYINIVNRILQLTKI